MDFDFTPLKGRIGEAFVENILRRAGYQVSRLGRDSQTQHLLKIGEDEFLPDFLVWKKVNGRPDSERFLHRLLMIEVKYQASLGEYLRRDADAVCPRSKSSGPNFTSSSSLTTRSQRGLASKWWTCSSTGGTTPSRP